uniref:Uncharacterized protein n=1 Tax=Cacopsylla melanoneura TaxID=428564 RepID=A0A8D8WVV4_9HEMI
MEQSWILQDLLSRINRSIRGYEPSLLITLNSFPLQWEVSLCRLSSMRYHLLIHLLSHGVRLYICTSTLIGCAFYLNAYIGCVELISWCVLLKFSTHLPLNGRFLAIKFTINSKLSLFS